MHLTGRLLIACGLIVASQLVVVGIHRGTDPKPAELPQIGPTTIPENVGDFVGRDAPLDERTVAASNADAMLNRVYENRLGDTVIANIAIWVDFGRGIPHKPEQCYPMAGWEVVNRSKLTVPVSDHQPLHLKQYVFQRDMSRIAVAYWVYLGDQTITDSEEIRPILQRLRRSGGIMPPLVKVMLHTDAPNIEQAQARLSRFVAALAPYTNAIH
jgi:EpsI family protein